MLIILTKKTTDGAPEPRTAIVNLLEDEAQTASVTFAATAAKKILGEHGKIKRGWFNCRIRRVEGPIKCFKYWHYGHLATKCTSTAHPSTLYAKCSATGHKTSDRKEKPRYALCTNKGNAKNCAHMAGSSKCTTARELNLNLTIISEPYRHLDAPFWVTDASTKAVIWACGKRPFQSTASNSTQNGFVKPKFDRIHFYSCYAPSSFSTEEFTHFLDRLAEDAKQHFPLAIAGDFNAWAVDWGSKVTNTKRHAVLEAMSSLDLVLLNSSDEPAFIREEASSIVDLTFMSSSLAKGKCSWRVIDIYTANDHGAIVWETCTRQRVISMPEKANCIGWRVNTFQSTSFSAALDERPVSGSNATEKSHNIIKQVTEVCDTTMTRKRTTNQHPPVYWWNDTIAILQKKSNKRLFERGHKKTDFEEVQKRYKTAHRKLSKDIKCSKALSWSELLDEVKGDLWGRPYKVVMTRLKRQQIPSPTCPVLLKKIVTVLFPHQPELHYPDIPEEEIMWSSITREELMEACNRVGNTKARGFGGILDIAPKAAIHEMPKFLDVYNECLREDTLACESTRDWYYSRKGK
ncbi:uncharacterized protein LOC114841562 [Diachasma alloeum]|uniref:uncharacterized protein LOC114841562 n=1 Tax=Diachasma alloeum TaxID=454923 RepID=UPI0010FB5270|nr:uncharacterized protein LOC114841562 [Diachasma alloeum]